MRQGVPAEVSPVRVTRRRRRPALTGLTGVLLLPIRNPIGSESPHMGTVPTAGLAHHVSEPDPPSFSSFVGCFYEIFRLRLCRLRPQQPNDSTYKDGGSGLLRAATFSTVCHAEHGEFCPRDSVVAFVSGLVPTLATAYDRAFYGQRGTVPGRHMRGYRRESPKRKPRVWVGQSQNARAGIRRPLGRQSLGMPGRAA